MSVRRIVPNIRTGTGPGAESDATANAAVAAAMKRNAEFYGLLGLQEVMNHGWIMTLASPSHPSAQISIVETDATAPVTPDMSMEVEDVDAAYTAMQEGGAEIVYPLHDEDWGVRRFFVRAPDGRVINVLGHR
ncbi:VOC family protein [Streptomyces atratus]|nr:VOC family protein [Streptomyces atratus]WPW28550.1 VOC family protein [Streptomyces atratus]GGT30026.1 glyoxalase [Streptomyces atratus]